MKKITSCGLSEAATHKQSFVESIQDYGWHEKVWTRPCELRLGYCAEIVMWLQVLHETLLNLSPDIPGRICVCLVF